MPKYPVAYRADPRPSRNSPQGGGFQGQPRSPTSFNGPVKPPRLPANQNLPKVPPGLASLGRKGALKFLARFVPYAGLGLSAWELWQLYRQLGPQKPTTATIIANCGAATNGPFPNSATTCAQTSFHKDTKGQWAETGSFWYATMQNGSNFSSAQPNFYVNPRGQTWRVPKTSSPTMPQIDQGYRWHPRPVETPVPWVDPLSNPVGKPMPDPWAPPVKDLPDRQPNPNRDPNEQDQRGHETRPVRRTVETIFSANTKPRTRVRVNPRRERPPPREEERKKRNGQRAGNLPHWARRAQKVMQETTEYLDLLDALYKSLPKKRQRKDDTPQDKAWSLWKYRDEIDWKKAAEEVAKNQVLDSIIGNASGRADAFGNEIGVTMGLAF